MNTERAQDIRRSFRERVNGRPVGGFGSRNDKTVYAGLAGLMQYLRQAIGKGGIGKVAVAVGEHVCRFFV